MSKEFSTEMELAFYQVFIETAVHHARTTPPEDQGEPKPGTPLPPYPLAS